MQRLAVKEGCRSELWMKSAERWAADEGCKGELWMKGGEVSCEWGVQWTRSGEMSSALLSNRQTRVDCWVGNWPPDSPLSPFLKLGIQMALLYSFEGVLLLLQISVKRYSHLNPTGLWQLHLPTTPPFPIRQSLSFNGEGYHYRRSSSGYQAGSAG